MENMIAYINSEGQLQLGMKLSGGRIIYIENISEQLRKVPTTSVLYYKLF